MSIFGKVTLFEDIKCFCFVKMLLIGQDNGFTYPFKVIHICKRTFISFAKPLTGLCTNKPPCKISGIESFLPIKINLNRLTNKMMSASKFFWDVKSSLRKYLKVFTQLFAESSSCPKNSSYRKLVKTGTFLKWVFHAEKSPPGGVMCQNKYCPKFSFEKLLP